MAAYKDPRTKSWRYRKWVQRPDGTRVRITGTPPIDTKAAAETAERRHIERVFTPEKYPQASVKKETLAEHAEKFLEHYKPDSKPSAKRERRDVWRLLEPAFGDRAPSEVTQFLVDSWAQGLLEQGLAIKTVNNRLGVLSSLLRYSTGSKPPLRLKLSGKPAEVGAVTSEDIDKLLATCDDDRYTAAILLAAEAGLRAGEIRGLQWGDIRDNQLTVRRALDVTGQSIAPKHNKFRSVPLSPKLNLILNKLPRRGLWVVSRLDGGAIGYWTLLEAIIGVYANAGISKPEMPMHSLRHSFGTQMAKRVPLPVLRDLMGHSEISTTLRYVSVGQEDRVEAIGKVFGVAQQLPKQSNQP